MKPSQHGPSEVRRRHRRLMTCLLIGLSILVMVGLVVEAVRITLA